MRRAADIEINANSVSGEFLDMAGERYYAIRNVDKMAPFFISVISNVDHWMFVSSTGGLTAGRVSPETALFPYITVDRIHESSQHTGSKTVLRVASNGPDRYWEPFNREHDRMYAVSRNLYKNLLGNRLCFEEVNHDLRLAFRYTWETSDDFGFVRRSELENLGKRVIHTELIDGLQNILPAGTPSLSQANSSNLVNAYKWTELDAEDGLALYTLFSGISDRAEPSESLKANTVFCLGLEGNKVLLSSNQLGEFRAGNSVHQDDHTRGVRGMYLVNEELELKPRQSRQWQIIANIEQTQSQVVELKNLLDRPADVAEAIALSVVRGNEELARIMAAADGFQAAAEENVTVHHYANVVFNVLRGGIFDEQYIVSAPDFAASVEHFNGAVYRRNRVLLDSLPVKLGFPSLLETIKKQGDPQLERLCYEYLPITFGRRHGDPSRPWNRFEIRLKDEYGNRLLSYQGNWRDIFQNWEALTFSYPEFVENVVAKFVNASTMDGYNPYRITKQGFDWEVEEPDDPWSYIGYWGDHQIIYLQKLLELSHQFHPGLLNNLLRQPIFCYANVPYRIKPLSALLEDPKNTVIYDHDLAERIAGRVERMGADGKLVLDADGDVYQVTLAEKLLVPLLGKLGNFVIDGGIWLNTQRPEWNDANNALVGNGLSMVTLYYMRRYIGMLLHLLADESDSMETSAEVCRWLAETAAALRRVVPLLGGAPVSASLRYESLRELGLAASRYREAIYKEQPVSGKSTLAVADIRAMLDDALVAIDHSIASNRRDDGLYHAYNLMIAADDAISVDTLYPMLEGQVAAISSGAMRAEESCSVLDALFASDIYRADQHSFMLYPDRHLPGFLQKNRVPVEDVEAIPLLQTMLAKGDSRIVTRDAEGCYRFSAEFRNVGDLNDELDRLAEQYATKLEAARVPLQSLYEKVFNHRAFTGRSGGMFGFEGLGCIYWHMVSKLLLAVQERFFAALEDGASAETRSRLARHYYDIREGIGFNKTPAEFGAFPTDPYSHTPGHGGARQPGMTGQVKEEVLSRFGELGLRISGGSLKFHTSLLRRREFLSHPRQFCYLDVDGDWQEIEIPGDGLAFTWCQVPVVYRLDDNVEPGVAAVRHDGSTESWQQLALPDEESAGIFRRSGRIRSLSVTLGTQLLLAE